MRKPLGANRERGVWGGAREALILKFLPSLSCGKPVRNQGSSVPITAGGQNLTISR
ncbi:MAG: hypothetical protein HYW48_07245 [Deltaproteobacteria bacterium]|nr:hypothetical protein [Deltaproteobacteria bacterium]